MRDIDRKELDQRIESIHNKYAERLNCAERVFLTLHAILGADIPSEAVTMLTGFGGGVGLTREDICGAVSGGVAAIGLVHGRRNPPEGERERAYEVTRDFVCRFRAKFGATVCRELIGDLPRESTPEADKKRGERCLRYSLNAAKMCVDTLTKYEKVYPPE